MITKFQDPINYPVVFTPLEREKIFFALKKFLISFDFYPNQRSCYIQSMVIKQLDSYFISKDIYQDSSVIMFNKNVSQNIVLNATNSDIQKTNFALKFVVNSDESMSLPAGSLQTINQPTGTKNDIMHMFSMSNSTWGFLPYHEGDTDYYPSAYLHIYFYPYVENTSYVWTNIDLPDMSNTLVVISPQNSYGVLDAMATVRLKWYLDQERTIISPITPSLVFGSFKFGMRFCISNRGGLFKKEIQQGFKNIYIAQSMYSTTTLQGVDPYAQHDVLYWGSGGKKEDLFYGNVFGLEIADDGLPIQYSKETAVYWLQNDLEDSSSFSSASSMSSSSMSSTSSSSSEGTSSSEGISSWSSMSSSSSSTDSSSSTNAKEYSSSSSSSSSTAIKSYSSSSSSIEDNRVVLYYGFSQKYDDFMNVIDESLNGHTAKIFRQNNAPIWSDVDGIHGGRYTFVQGAGQAQNIILTPLSDFSTLHLGSISFWSKINSQEIGLPASAFSIVNAPMSTTTTELMIGFMNTGEYIELIAGLTIESVSKWEIGATLGESIVNNWVNVVIAHDGIKPTLYVDGLVYPFTYKNSSYKNLWISSLFSPDNLTLRASRLIIGATTRAFFPYIVFGYPGELDEIKMWSCALSADSVYNKYKEIRP